MELKWKICLCIIVCIIAPFLVGQGVSADILNNWTNSNDWIGFWGSYLGAIFGGIITLIVMKRTIKSNEEILKADKKQDFMDNTMSGLVEYHMGLKDFVDKISRDKAIAIDMAWARELSIKSAILHTRLVCIKDNAGYSDSNKMLESLECVTEKFNHIVDKKIENATIEEQLYDDINKELEDFLENVESFYSENSIY